MPLLRSRPGLRSSRSRTSRGPGLRTADFPRLGRAAAALHLPTARAICRENED